MGIDKSNNILLTSPIQPIIPPSTDIGNVCVDKVGIGHTCYIDGTDSTVQPMATCVTGCMSACTAHLERKVYTAAFYKEFSHLFGKDLQKEEDCVEICSLSCRGCEKVTISGSKRFAAGSITTWSLLKTISVGSQTLKVFTVDLTTLLPVTATASADNPTIFSTIYLNDVKLPRAGYPDCMVVQDVSRIMTEFNCTYATPVNTTKASTISFTSATFSPRVNLWSASATTNASPLELELRLNKAESAANLLYSVASIDVVANEMKLAAGGSQINTHLYTDGPTPLMVDAPTAARAGFRVENVFDELDAPGEWYFNPSTKILYVIPLDSTATVATMQASVLEIPLLRQIIRISGSRENHYTTSAHASVELVETDSTVHAGYLTFRQLTFSGSQLLSTDVYERIPSLGPGWPMARIGAVFMESVENIVIEHCVFEKIGGNALVVSGESDTVQFSHNNLSYIGSSAIALLPRIGVARNSYQVPVGAKLLYSRTATISNNQIHHFGRRVAHSAAIMIGGSSKTSVSGNLIYAYPTGVGPAAVNYYIRNADGAHVGGSQDNLLMPALFRPIAEIIIPPTQATNLGTPYTVTVPVTGIDFPVIAKLIGAPECPSGSGRIGSLYGEETPFTYTQCSGCCSVHDSTARIRVFNSNVNWVSSTRSVVVRPGDTIELYAISSAYFNSVVDVYLAFHIVTPNQIIELSTRAHWQIVTRKCIYAEQTYTAKCGGPCANAGPSGTGLTALRGGCGNSNIAIQMYGALGCDPGYEADVTTHVCTGPFEAQADCDGSGLLQSQLYYNCEIQCMTTMCT